jgi:hypothetical protein
MPGITRHGAQVQFGSELFEFGGITVDDRDVVLLRSQIFCHRTTNLACTKDDDIAHKFISNGLIILNGLSHARTGDRSFGHQRTKSHVWLNLRKRQLR